MGNLFTELMRRLFGLLDNIVIFLIETLYNLIIMIADTNVLGDLIYHYLGRIYVFLGIFMVFKLSFSMITYIVNPDSFTDKGKGFGKLISNVIISLILLVATPTLFNVAFDIQSDILKTNAIYQIVTGKKLSNDSAASNNEKMGKQIAYGIYSTFIYKDTGDDSYNLDISEGISADTDSAKVPSGKCNNTSNPSCLVDMDTLLKKTDNGKDFANKYWYLVSTICGGFVTYILLGFCFDTAVRSVKLGFLQIIAPIPILSMLDPKKGNEKLMKWLKECGKTFLSLFIRLAGLFLVVDIIGVILGINGDIKGMYTYTTGNPQTNLFVRLFVIIGLLMFAKQMPQLISDLLGIKLDGDGFSLKKKLGGIPGLGAAKALGAGAVGFAGGMAANTLASKNNFSWDKDQSFWKNMGNNAIGGLKSAGSIAAGGISGFSRGTFSKEKSLWKAGAAGAHGAIEARNLRDERRLNDDVGPVAFMKRTGTKISNAAGVDSGSVILDKMSASLDDVGTKKKAIEDYISSLESVDKANKALATANAIGDRLGIENAITALKAAKDAAWRDTSDKALESLINSLNVSITDANRLNPTAEISVIDKRDDRGDLDKSAKQASDANIILQNSPDWKKKHAGAKRNKNK